MNEAFIGAVAALVGVLLGSILEHFRSRSQFQRERRWEVLREQRARLEELYMVVDEARGGMLALADDLRRQCRTGNTAQSNSSPIPWPRIRLLIDFYAPSLTRAYQNLIEVVSDFGRIAADVDRHLTSEEAERMAGSVTLASFRVQQQFEAFIQELITVGQQLGDRLQVEAEKRADRIPASSSTLLAHRNRQHG